MLAVAVELDIDVEVEVEAEDCMHVYVLFVHLVSIFV